MRSTTWLQKNRSCETQLVTTIHDIATHLNSGNQVDVLFLDFSYKAFDKVPHKRLLYKLNYYRISGPYLEWIEQFLTDRTQQVVVENKFSALTPVISGVPKGLCSAPCYFYYLLMTYLSVLTL